ARRVAGLHPRLADTDVLGAGRPLITGLHRAGRAGAGPVLEGVPLAAVGHVAVAVGPARLAGLDAAHPVHALLQRVVGSRALHGAGAAVLHVLRGVGAVGAAAGLARHAALCRRAAGVAAARSADLAERTVGVHQAGHAHVRARIADG